MSIDGYSPGSVVRRIAKRKLGEISKKKQNSIILPPVEYVHKERGKIYVPHNEEERDFVYSDSPRYGLLKGGEGAGKALALDTPLPTPIGWTTMREVKVDDYLLDEEGKPCLVIATSEVMKNHKCYEVVFDDGSSIVADAEHLWLTTKLFTTQEILDTVKDNHAIKLPSGEFRYITEVKEHKSVDVKCVMVNSPSHLYLAGGGMIPTHNSVAGIIKDLERIRRAMSGIMVSPDFPHFRKSLWPEFRNWCPVHWVVESQQYRLKQDWNPGGAFELVFINGASLLCGGIERPGSWEGPNRSFWHLDEGRHADAEALKVLDGRARIPGPNGEPPQGYITTTPKKNWLYEYFGPKKDNDPYFIFKDNSRVVTLSLELNKANLSDGYVEMRRASLTESEARVRVFAEWEDESDTEKFVNIFWWDGCYEPLPPLTKGEPAIISLDAATGSETSSNLCDCFAVVVITRHPTNKKNVAVRYCGIWQPEPGKFLDFKPIEDEVIRLIQNYTILEVTYDMTQLHDMCTRLKNTQRVNVKPFDQNKARLIADRTLQNYIIERRISHDGNPLLRQHIDNADIKKYGQDGIRIVKRANSLKVDASVAVSQGVTRCLYYNIG